MRHRMHTSAPSRYVHLAGIRFYRASLCTSAVLVLVIIAAAIVGLLLGDYPMTLGQTVAGLFGLGDDPLIRYFVQDQRLPRVFGALMVGAALGLAGNIFQRLSNNPLGSPDIIGFSTGSASGALFAIIILQAGPAAIGVGAMLGGVASATLVYLLSIKNRKVSGTQLVLVGIGAAAILQALNSILIVRAELGPAQTAAQWLAGSLNATTWPEIGVLVAILAVVVPLALLLARPLQIMLSGDDLAAGLGVRVHRRRREMIAVGVVLTALSVAIAGPIAFVALAAPQLARRFDPGVAMVNSGLMGAVLVLLSDIIAQRLLAPVQLPVGVVTGSLGGVYLIWLLLRKWHTNDK